MARTHSFYPEEFPEAWASEWGEDEYGLWMVFSYKGVRQSFRWCEPGTFMMGSPEDEPERSSNERQHQVTLTKGFWLGDTTVTQSLWQAVMDSNPSEFQNPQCPVESVNWHDIQEFLHKLNTLKPELRLCLPTEAQWEYGCRAGTTSPFFWGRQIDSTLVNFNGGLAYDNGRKSEYRKRTVEVKELPCNGWGLYQMHGNVFEWCQDLYCPYSGASMMDPAGPKEGDFHVLRGGSWIYNGRYCRSAYRFFIVPSNRGFNIGFRLARGH